MNITVKVENGLLTIAAEGRIDSSNAAAVEEQINACLRDNPHTAVALDYENLEYTSSAGLRVILRVRKAEPTLKIINVNPEVYEVLDMTGFPRCVPLRRHTDASP